MLSSSKSFLARYVYSILIVLCVAVSLFLKVPRVVSSFSRIDLTTGTLGVRIPLAYIRSYLLTGFSQDVEIHHLETAKPLEFSNITVVSQGPLRASVRAEVRYGQSTVSVTVSLVIRILGFCPKTFS